MAYTVPAASRKHKLVHTLSSSFHQRITDKPKLGHTLSLTGNRFKADSPSLSYQKLDKLWRKREKTQEELLEQLGRKDENVRDFLKTAENHEKDDGSLSDLKSNFERNNMKTNTSIQLLQKKLDKYQQQIREMEESGIVNGSHNTTNINNGTTHHVGSITTNSISSGGKAIIKSVQHSVQSGIADAVAKPLESINNFRDTFMTKKEKLKNTMSLGGGGGEYGDNYLTSFHSIHSTSDEDCCSNPSPTVKDRNSNEQHTTRTKKQEEDIQTLNEKMNEMTTQNAENKQLMSEYSARLGLLLDSVQIEKERRDQLESRLRDLYDQWNDSTELHQNEMYAMKDEMERAMETIECVEYRFTGRTADIEEEVEQCKTRLSKLEHQQQQQQHQQRIHTFLDIDAKIHLSRIFSFVIYLVVVVVVVVLLPVRFAMSSRFHMLVSVVVVVVGALVWRYEESCWFLLSWLRGAVTEHGETSSGRNRTSKIVDVT